MLVEDSRYWEDYDYDYDYEQEQEGQSRTRRPGRLLQRRRRPLLIRRQGRRRPRDTLNRW